MAIFGTLPSVQKLLSHDSRFHAVFAYLQKLQTKDSDEALRLHATDIGTCVKIELEEEGAFALEQVYMSKERHETFFESHRRYIDVQYIYEGEEIMEVAPIGSLPLNNPYTPEHDYASYTDTGVTSILRIREGELALFFPDDVHMPCLKVNESALVRKSVIKVPV